MMPPDKRTGPSPKGWTGSKKLLAGGCSNGSAARTGALDLERRPPLYVVPATPAPTFGLSMTELISHARDLRRRGWQEWETIERLGISDEVVA